VFTQDDDNLNNLRPKTKQKEMKITNGFVDSRHESQGSVPMKVRPNLELPGRYSIRESDGARFLRCVESPTLRVSIEQSYAFNETDARKLGERIIFLDGAAQFGPLLDDDKQFYNLDHHQGCLRVFTLATCEQAMILVLKGLELDKGDWLIYANEPDLDTLFAIWVLLNYKRIRQMTPETRDSITPLIRLEGAIDANGFEIAEFCGLSQELLKTTQVKLDKLHHKELELKRSGAWDTMDLAEYTMQVLGEIDNLVYTRSDFVDFENVEEEYGHIDIGNQRVAVLCRDSSGIYEVERRLKKIWGDRLGIIVLQKDRVHYTLRRSASLAGIDLDKAYNMLNLIDPNVDGRPPEKRWGGSDDIGGSPRPKGTGLSPNDIGKVLNLAYQSQGIWNRLKRIFLAVVSVAGLIMTAAFSVWLLPKGQSLHHSVYGFNLSTLLFILVLTIGAVGLSLLYNHKWRWLFGWRRPVGRDWLLLAPSVLISAIIGGAWVPHYNNIEATIVTVIAIMIFSLALELTFRGLAYGMLILDFNVQRVSGHWFISLPAFLTAILYALTTFWANKLGFIHHPSHPDLLQEVTLLVGGAFIAGLALGMIRERTLSLLPGIGLQIAASFLHIVLENF